MRLCALLFTAILVAAPVRGQQPPASPPADAQGAGQGPAAAAPQAESTAQETGSGNLPVSLDKIKEALQQSPAMPALKIDERPTFRIQIQERQKIEELLATLKFKNEPTPAGGIYMQEQNRIMFNPVDHPTMQPMGAFNQGQLLTILIENLVGHYLGGKVGSAVSKAERAHAEAQAREDVRLAVTDYCNAQPNAGAGLQICSSLGR
ncbi:MAG TPA: hypothetical protein VKE51_36450 [Vicinamibacterales bacterium]|nr:hypothetical protein [Vicinamibacterales bacterium]